MIDERRSEIEIIQEILSLTQKGVKKTQILYGANLSYTLLENYLTFLLDKEVIQKKIQKHNGATTWTIYQTTKKGDDLLFTIQKTMQYLE